MYKESFNPTKMIKEAKLIAFQNDIKNWSISTLNRKNEELSQQIKEIEDKIFKLKNPYHIRASTASFRRGFLNKVESNRKKGYISEVSKEQFEKLPAYMKKVILKDHKVISKEMEKAYQKQKIAYKRCDPNPNGSHMGDWSDRRNPIADPTDVFDRWWKTDTAWFGPRKFTRSRKRYFTHEEGTMYRKGVWARSDMGKSWEKSVSMDKSKEITDDLSHCLDQDNKPKKLRKSKKRHK